MLMTPAAEKSADATLPEPAKAPAIVRSGTYGSSSPNSTTPRVRGVLIGV
jgi:hypothetical protein